MGIGILIGIGLIFAGVIYLLVKGWSILTNGFRR